MNSALFQFVHSSAHVSPLIDAVIVFTADYLAFIFFFALLGYEGWQWMKGRRARARTLLRAIGVSGFAWLAAEAVKVLVASPRPFLVIKGLEPLITHGGYDSFPSGHVTFFFALGVALYLGRAVQSGRSQRVLGILFMSVALLMGLARVAAGIHWPVDIVGAVLLGISVVIGLRACYYWGSRRWALDEDW